jgi:hypothetical protein
MPLFLGEFHDIDALDGEGCADLFLEEGYGLIHRRGNQKILEQVRGDLGVGDFVCLQSVTGFVHSYAGTLE